MERFTDMEFVKKLTQARFFKENFPQKCVNLDERISFSCVNNPSAACKVVEALYLYCKLTLLNSTPSICTQTRQNYDKNIVCLLKDFTPTN